MATPGDLETPVLLRLRILDVLTMPRRMLNVFGSEDMRYFCLSFTFLHQVARRQKLLRSIILRLGRTVGGEIYMLIALSLSSLPTLSPLLFSPSFVRQLSLSPLPLSLSLLLIPESKMTCKGIGHVLESLWAEPDTRCWWCTLQFALEFKLVSAPGRERERERERERGRERRRACRMALSVHTGT